MRKSRESARIRANRLNAQKSTGPRTREGKAQASQNARWHGLRSVVLDMRDLKPAAALIVGELEGPEALNFALEIARADLDVRLVCRLRAQMLAFPALLPADWKAVRREAARRNRAADLAIALSQTLPMTDARSARVDRLFAEAAERHRAILDLLAAPAISLASYLQDDIRVLVTYELRAMGRRRTALRKLNRLASTANCRERLIGTPSEFS